MRSNKPNAYCRLTKSWNASWTTPSGVTITICVPSAGRSAIYASHRMLAARHRSTMLERNESNGTTTIVTPGRLAAAGNMNNTLLPTLVPITATTRLRRCTMARSASSCTPRNSASTRCVICRNIWRWSACFTAYYRRTCWWQISGAILSGPTLPTRPHLISVLRVDTNPKNRCHLTLTRRNLSHSYTVCWRASIIARLYTYPPILRS